MGNLLFSPSGRINSNEFMKGATFLVLVTFVLGLLPIISLALGLLQIVTFVFIWCWIVLWVKRYHDGGKSGWMCLLPIIVYLVVVSIASVLVSGMFVDADAAAAATEAATEAAEAGDIAAVFKLALSGGGGVTKMGVFATAAVGAAVSYGIAFLFNNMIKGDEHENQYGPNGSAANAFD